LLERGITIRKGRRQAEEALPAILQDAEAKLTGMRSLVARLASELKQLEVQIAEIDAMIAGKADDHEACQRLMAIPGIGPITATAIVSAVGNGAEFRKGRGFSSWLGLTPAEYSTGGKQKLLGISKRGNGYLCKLLVHGARSVMQCREKQAPGLRTWLGQLISRSHPNVVTIALANKMARMAWALLAKGETYRPALMTSNMEAASAQLVA
jgi:transposase